MHQIPFVPESVPEQQRQPTPPDLSSVTIIDIMAQLRQTVHEFAPPSCSETVFDLSYTLTSLGRRHNVQSMEEDNEPLRDPGVTCFDRIKGPIEDLRQLSYKMESLPDIRTTFQDFDSLGDLTMQSQHFLHQKYEDINFSSPDIFNRLFPVYLPISRTCSPQHETVPPHQRSSYSELSANVAFLNGLEKDRIPTPSRPTEPQQSSSRSASPGTPNISLPRLKHKQPFPTGVKRAPKKKSEPQKKQQMACFFCRDRKIACGGPVSEDGDDKTCKQCKTRGKTCQYAAESRRGQHRRIKRPKLTGDLED